jgi:hypothetical protein
MEEEKTSFAGEIKKENILRKKKKNMVKCRKKYWWIK